MNSTRVFPFFISFFCWNEINKKSSAKEDTRKMENCKANHILDRSGHRRCSVRKCVLRNFKRFTGKHLCQSLFLIKLQAAKFSRTSFLKNTFRRQHLFRVNMVSDYYARRIYIKVFLWIIVLWILVPSKYLELAKILKRLANLFKKIPTITAVQVFCRELHL